MIERASRQQLARWLQEFPAVALLGPRQVGKTTLALQWAAGAAPSVYVDVEDPTDLARLADALTFMEANADRLVIIDEIQRAPHLFPLLRGVIDRRRREGRPTGHFLLLGSASGALLAQSA